MKKFYNIGIPTMMHLMELWIYIKIRISQHDYQAHIFNSPQHFSMKLRVLLGFFIIKLSRHVQKRQIYQVVTNTEHFESRE